MENLFTQVDDQGRSEALFHRIMDHRVTEDAVTSENGWIILPNGIKKRKVTTKGWDIFIEWKDGSSSWLPLSEVKKSNPIELAE